MDDWTFDQIHDAWTGGKRRKGGKVRSAAEARKLAKDWRKMLGL